MGSAPVEEESRVAAATMGIKAFMDEAKTYHRRLPKVPASGERNAYRVRVSERVSECVWE